MILINSYLYYRNLWSQRHKQFNVDETNEKNVAIDERECIYVNIRIQKA